MYSITKKQFLVGTMVFLLIVCAIVLQQLPRLGIVFPGAMLLRSGIYIGLMAAWGISIRKRIIQTQVQRYLVAASAFMVLWLLFRTIKFSIDSMDVRRWLWYLYYFPMLFIPLLALFVSMSLAKAENYRLPRRSSLLYVPSTLLLLLVLTNDLHQWVFSFPSGVFTDLDYDYEFGYYLILGWILLCAALAFFNMLLQCRIPGRRAFRWLPLVPLFLSVLYTLAYIQKLPLLRRIAWDMTVAQCLLITAMFEACIVCGLIHSNRGYDALFEATTISAQITDPHFHILYASALKNPLTEDDLRQMVPDTFRLNRSTLVKRHRLRHGFVFWQEDISELNRLTEELELAQEELRSTGDVLQAENEQQARWLRLTEENRLFDMMQDQTARQVGMLQDLLARLQSTQDLTQARHLLGQIIVLGTYVKRRTNLIFVSMQRGSIPAHELSLCLNESSESLNLYGITCRTMVSLRTPPDAGVLMSVYDLFEAVIEAGLDTMQSLLFSVEGSGDALQVHVCLAGQTPLDSVISQFPGVEVEQDEDGLQYLTQHFRSTPDRRGEPSHGHHPGEL